MPELTFEDDCLAPDRRILITYNGPNAFEVYKKIKDIVKNTLHIGSSKYFERDFRWDSTSGSFYIKIYAKHPIDNLTQGWYEIILEGQQPPNSDKGKLTISIYPRLYTTLKLETPFQNSAIYKGFLMLYIKLFYRKTREKYLEMCRSLALKLERQIREMLGLPIS